MLMAVSLVEGFRLSTGEEDTHGAKPCWEMFSCGDCHLQDSVPHLGWRSAARLIRRLIIAP